MEKDDNKSYIDIVGTPPNRYRKSFYGKRISRFNRTFKGTI